MPATSLDLSQIKTDALSSASAFRALIGLGTLATVSPTGTPDGTKFLRDDGSWQAVNLSAYLPLAGGTMTGALAITQGTANTSVLTSTGYSLTGSNAQSLVDLAGTWNTSGTPTAIKLNVTDTASNAASLLMDLQVGGSSRFRVDKVGQVTLIPGTQGAPAITFGTSNTGFFGSSNSFFWVAIGSIKLSYDSGYALWLRDNGANLALGASADVRLYWDASGVLAQRNGTSPQVHRWYNTFTDASNYERGVLDWSTTSNVLRIGTEAAGTGTVRNISLVGGNVGIGTTSPATKFDVRVNAASNGVVTLQNTAANGWSSVIILGSDGNERASFGFGNPSAPVLANQSFFNLTSDFAINLQNTNRFFISTATGNIGIGTQTPNYRLDVSGTLASGPVTIVGGTVTSSTPALSVTQTWNNAATTFTGILSNVTDTASNAASLLMDLQVGGSSRFSVKKWGQVTVASSGSLSTINPGTYNGELGFGNNNTAGSEFSFYVNLNNRNVAVRSDGFYAFAASTANNGDSTLDVRLYRDAADTLAQRRSTNPQVHRIYNLFTDASNYERAKIAWESSVLRIGTEKAGTGSARALELQTDGTTRLTIDTSGNTILANGFLFFQDTNGWISRLTSTNSLSFASSNNTTHMSLSNAWLDVYTNGIRGRSGLSGGTQQTFTYGVNDRGGNTGVGHVTRLSGGNGSTATTGSAGGNAEILGGSANGTGNNNGGNVLLDGGAATGTGISGSFIVGSVRSTLTCFGGTTSSFPAIKRNAAALNFRLADDSGDCDITAKAATFSGNVTLSTVNLVTDTTTGTKIGTATNQKLGFFDKTPVVQPTAVADATDAASVITQLNALLSRMRDLGLIAT